MERKSEKVYLVDLLFSKWGHEFNGIKVKNVSFRNISIYLNIMEAISVKEMLIFACK